MRTMHGTEKKTLSARLLHSQLSFVEIIRLTDLRGEVVKKEREMEGRDSKQANSGGKSRWLGANTALAVRRREGGVGDKVLGQIRGHAPHLIALL